MSGNSWANMGQECIKCHINVYPHKQVRGGGWGLAGDGVGEGTGEQVGAEEPSEWEEAQGSRRGVFQGLYLEQIEEDYLFPY